MFCIGNGCKEKINEKKITKVLEKYEIIGIRTSEDRGKFNNEWYYYQQITYTLKEEYLIPIKKSDKYIIFEDN